MTTAVTITRERHPLQGQALAMLGRIHRHGRLELLLVLSDGSKRLIPAEWTNFHNPEHVAQERVSAAIARTLGTTADLLALCGLVSALSARAAGSGEQAARQSPSKEDFHAACPTQFAPTAGPDIGNTPTIADSAAAIAGGHRGHRSRRDDRESVGEANDAGPDQYGRDGQRR